MKQIYFPSAGILAAKPLRHAVMQAALFFITILLAAVSPDKLFAQAAIAVSGAPAALSTTPGTASSSTSFTISGSGLTPSGVLIVTPPPGFDLSVNNGISWEALGVQESFAISAVGSLLNTTIYVRLDASDAVNTYPGNFTINVAGNAAGSVITTGDPSACTCSILTSGGVAIVNIPAGRMNAIPLTNTTTSISSSNNPSFAAAPGNFTTFTATVTNSGSPVTSGTVSFTSNGTTISGGGAVAVNGSGQATLTTPFPAEGAYTINATYNGTATFATSNSSSLIQNVNPQPPTIANFSPATGPVGTLVTINGTNLNNPTAFTIGGTSAIVVSNTGNTLVAMVMPGTTTGGVSLTTSGGTTSGSAYFTVTPTLFPSAQQGAKLVAANSSDVADQGWSVSISADGNTAIVGGISDSPAGAAWIYTRSGGTWTQQAKLVGAGSVGAASQGRSVSLSADGNTAIVGGPTDNNNVGAAWVYTRNNGVWTPQGAKLVASNFVQFPQLGFSVSLSADGNTAIIGGDEDNSGVGAAWIYTRSGGVWTQGSKLIGSDGANTPLQGFSVSMSADGNTAIVGGSGDNHGAGAAWVYSHNSGVWLQQGSKLVGMGAVGSAQQGESVSLSADGNTAIVGGGQDNNGAGAAWVYTRSGVTWTPQGSKLIANDGVGAVAGWSVSLNADGNTAIVGGYGDNSFAGAAWVYTRSAGAWAQQGSKLVGTGITGPEAFQGYAAGLSADGSTAMVGGPYDNSQHGTAWVYVVNPTTVTSITLLDPTPNNSSSVQYSVTFAAPVSGLGTGNFTATVVSGNITGASVISISGSNPYVVQVNTGSGSGSLRLDMTNVLGLTTGVINAPYTTGAVYDIDKTAPTVSISAPSVLYVNQSAQVSYTVTYNDVNLNNASISLTSQDLLGNLTQTGSPGLTDIDVQDPVNNTVRVIFTASGDGTIAFTVPINTARDNANNFAGASSLSTAFTVDDTAPTVTIGAPSVAITNTGPVSYNITFADANFGTSALSNTDISDNIVTTGPVGYTGVSVTGSGTSYTATFSGIQGNGTIGFSIPAGAATDLAGNQSAASLASATFSVDNTAPVVTSITATTPSNANPTNATTLTYTVTFSKPVTGVDASDFSLTTFGTLGAVTNVSGSGNTYTVTVSSAPDGTGTLRLDLNSSGTGIEDAVGNAISGGFTGGDTYNIDNTAPTVFATDYRSSNNNKLLAKPGDEITLHFGISEPINTPTLTIAGHAITATNIGGNSWVATYTMTSGDSEGRIPFGLSFTDLAGNPQSGAPYSDIAAGVDIEFDKTPPTVSSITAISPNPTGATAVGYLVTFSEPVTGIDASDFTVTTSGVSFNSISAPTSAASNCIVTVSGISGTGTLRLDLNNSGDPIADAAGNTLVSGFTTGDVYTIDQTAPAVVSFTKSDPDPTNETTLHYQLTFSEPVTGVDASDFTVLAESLSTGAITVSAVSSTVYNIIVNNVIGDGTLQVALNNGFVSISDLAGNNLAEGATSDVYNVHQNPPTVNTITATTPSNANPTNATSVTYAVTFSEAVTGVNAADFAVTTNGTASGAVTNVSGSFANYTITVSGISGTGTLRLDLKNGTGIQDAAGNAASGFTGGDTYTIDNTPPTVLSITATTPSNATTTNAISVTYTVTFSEPVTGINDSDFSVTTTGNVSGAVTTIFGGPLVYAVAVDNISGSGTLRLDLKNVNNIQDAAGNGASGFASGDIYTIDNTPPTITSFSPATGPVGTLVTINGTNLSAPTAFTIGGQSAIVISNDGSTLVAMVMPGAATGGVSLTTADGTTSGSSNFTTTATPYPSAQQGNKLVGTGGVSPGWQGTSTAVSADGNTAAVGAPYDATNNNGATGAVWIYTRSGGTWTQQGSKLVGTGATAPSFQGYSVSLSADGNTVLIGGTGDDGHKGAAWVFTRSGGVWTQQGAKLVGTASLAPGSDLQGFSVSLSADGNTAIVGGFEDNSDQGAAWVFTRTGGIWSQQGKLVGTGSSRTPEQGYSVSLSADGNTAIVGGLYANSGQGAAWVYTRSFGTWSQQGSPLVGTGSSGSAEQGTAVSLSADGNTAIVGGVADNSRQGAAWVYTRSGGTWSQQGSKLVGTGNSGLAGQGTSVSLSADGNTAIVNGPGDNGGVGAAWVYTRSGGIWSQQGSKLVGTGSTGPAGQGSSVSLSADGGTATIGGNGDDDSVGAAWVFIANPTTTINSIAAVSPSPTNAATVQYTATFGALVSAITAGNFSLTPTGAVSGASIGAITGVGTNTLTITVNTGTGDGTIGLNLDNATGMTPGIITPLPFAGDVYTIDKTPPTVSTITATTPANTSPTNATQVSYTVTFSEPVTGVSANDFLLTTTNTPGGTALTTTGIGLVSGSGTTYTVTIGGIGGDGTLRLDLISSAPGITDAAGNAISGGFTGGDTYTIDNTAPAVVSFTKSDPDPTNKTTLHYQLTFSEPVTGVDASNFTVSAEGLTTGTITVSAVSPTVYNITVNNVTGDGTLQVALNNGFVSINDLAGNNLAEGATSDIYNVHQNPPAVNAITATTPSNANPTNATSVTYTVTFSEAVTGVNDGDFAVTTSGTASGAVTNVSGSFAAYTVTVSGISGTGTLRLDLNNGTGIQDAAGNAASGFTGGDTYTIDNTPPTVTIGSPSQSITSAGPVSYTVTYADANFNTSTLSPSNITLNATGTATGTVGVSGSGTSYTVTISGITGYGSLGISIAAGTASDLAGNLAPSAGPSATFAISSTDATLGGLSTGAGTLSPSFTSGQTTYTETVPNTTTSITVKPTANNTNAKSITVTAGGVTNTVSSGSSSPAIALAIGANIITVKITAQDGVTTDTYTITVTRTGASNANLSNLVVLSSCTLKPAFSANTTSYTASVSNSVTSVTVTPTTQDPTATVKVNGTTVKSGSASGPIALIVGANTITIVVTAQDGITIKTYTVIVTRAPSSNANLSNLAISPGTLTPAFSTNTTAYSATVSNTTTSLTVTPTTSDPTATIKVNGTTVISGKASGAIALAAGKNTINTVVTAQDGVTTKTYCITVTRTGSAIATLSKLAISSGTLAPVFATGTTSYTASVTNATTSITVTPTTSDATATVKVNGTTVKSGSASGSIALAVGKNTITTIVTAGNGTTTDTYTVTVTRAASAIATLSKLTISSGTLTPAFASGTTSYTASVTNATTSITVTPTTTDPTATVKVNGNAVTSGKASGSIALAVGKNTITTIVTAQNGTTTDTYTVTVTRASGPLKSLDMPVSVIKPADNVSIENDGVVVHQGVSPNGDGINDVLTIDGITAYPDNRLMIIDRNGTLIYQVKGYNNISKVFDGHSSINGRMQQPGTYFYSLDYVADGQNKHKTGYIILKY